MNEETPSANWIWLLALVVIVIALAVLPIVLDDSPDSTQPMRQLPTGEFVPSLDRSEEIHRIEEVRGTHLVRSSDDENVEREEIISETSFESTPNVSKSRILSAIVVSDSSHAFRQSHPDFKSKRLISGARIVVRYIRECISEFTTENGIATIPSIDEIVGIEISADGWATYREKFRGVGSQSKTFRVQPGGTYSGRVLDASGKGVEKALVTIQLPGVASSLEVPDQQTGGDGTFAFEGICAERQFTIRVEAKGYALFSDGPFTVPWKDTSHQDFVLQAGTTVAGVVRWDDGEAVVNALVSLIPEDSPVVYTPLSAWSNDDGRFEFIGAPAGRWILSSWLQRMPEIKHRRITLAAGDRHSDISIVRTRGLSIRGNLILDSSLTAIHNISATNWLPLSLLIKNENEQHKIQSSRMGDFEFHGLSPGSYTLSLAREGEVFSEPMSIDAGEQDITLEFMPAVSTLLVKALDETGQVLDNFEVDCRTADAIRCGRTAVWADNAWEVSELPPLRPLSVRVWSAGYKAVKWNDVTLNVNERRALEVRLLTIAPLRGIVRDDRGNPVPNTRVFMRSPDLISEFYGRATTDHGGRFEMNVPGLDGVLSTRSDSSINGHLTPVHAGRVQDISIDLPRGVRLRGRIVDASGRGRHGLQVNAQFPETSVIATKSITDAKGHFELPPLCAGEWDIVVRMAGTVRHLASRRVRIECTQIITLDEPFVLR